MKNYSRPIIEDEIVEIEDVIADSISEGGDDEEKDGE